MKASIQSIIWLFIVNVFAANVSAQTMVVNYSNGNRLSINVKDLSSIEFGDEPEVLDDETHHKGHEFVDLGLPSGTKWATMNLGAEKSTEIGMYYAWGETTGYYVSNMSRQFDTESYKFYKKQTTKTKDEDGFDIEKTIEGYTKYISKDAREYGYNGFYDDKTIMENADDAARINWGGEWRIPTTEECQELIDNCSITKCSLDGVSGCKVKGKNGNFIFIPYSGEFLDGSFLGDTSPSVWTVNKADRFFANCFLNGVVGVASIQAGMQVRCVFR